MPAEPHATGAIGDNVSDEEAQALASELGDAVVMQPGHPYDADGDPDADPPGGAQLATDPEAPEATE